MPVDNLSNFPFLVLLSLTIIFSFFNGFQASAKLVATMISSRAMSPRAALLIAASAEFAGPFFLGVAVAKTIGNDLTNPALITKSILIAALLSATLWNILTWYFGIPSSSSHALIGGLVGAVIVGAGVRAIQLGGLQTVLIALVTSPIIGFLGGILVMRLTLWIARAATPKASTYFKQAQLPTAVALAFSYGSNDAQKTMGLLTLGLVTFELQSNFVVSLWVTVLSALTLAAGTAIGGWRIIRTLGVKFYRIRPIHGFTSQFTSGVVVLAASLLGGPVSTTHVVSSAILGVGAAQRRSQVRWGVVSDIFVAWMLTVPVTMLMAACFYYPIKLLIP